MEKITITKDLFELDKDSPILWKDIKNFEFNDDDEIFSEYLPGDDILSSSFRFYVSRQVIETDEEYKERIEEYQKRKEESKKQRYAKYLEYKKEFEEDVNI
jgi:hypothetical protein